MDLHDLYHRLHTHFGARSNPDTWWPIYYAMSDPPAFERAITNILVQQSAWRSVKPAVDALHDRRMLTAAALAGADEAVIAACAQPTGLQTLKAARLKAMGAWVTERFGSEAAFCAGVTRTDLLTRGKPAIPGIGPETADRILLYTCGRLEWPVDTYCLRVLARYGVIAEEPTSSAGKRRAVDAIKAMVADRLPAHLEDWQRLHALLQLEGERLRQANTLLS